jgi:hypothetical protein
MYVWEKILLVNPLDTALLYFAVQLLSKMLQVRLILV